MQRRLLIDKVHTALNIFRFAHMVLIYMCRSILVDLCRACFGLLLLRHILISMSLDYNLPKQKRIIKTWVPTLCILNIGTVPMLYILYVGTVPTFCILNVGTVPTLCKLNVGTVPTLCIINIGTVSTFSPSELVLPQWPPL